MIVFLTLCYTVIMMVLVKTKKIPDNAIVKSSPAIFALLLLVVLFIPMQFSAPSGPVVLGRQAVQIVPNVAGPVTDIAIEAYTPLNKGDLLFKIDDTLYKAAVENFNAQLLLAERRLDQTSELQQQNAGSVFAVEAAEAQVESLKAQLDAAEFNLESTEVRAPADGHVTNLALREGTRVATAAVSAAMVFVDDSKTYIMAQIHQINLRNVAAGQEAEVVFKVRPGVVFTAKVERILTDLATGQIAPGGAMPMPGQVAPVPFMVLLHLDDEEAASSLPTGAVGSAAIYTGEFEISYLIRRVMMRMDAWLAYILPA